MYHSIIAPFLLAAAIVVALKHTSDGLAKKSTVAIPTKNLAISNEHQSISEGFKLALWKERTHIRRQLVGNSSPAVVHWRPSAVGTRTLADRSSHLNVRDGRFPQTTGKFKLKSPRYH